MIFTEISENTFSCNEEIELKFFNDKINYYRDNLIVDFHFINISKDYINLGNEITVDELNTIMNK